MEVVICTCAAIKHQNIARILAILDDLLRFYQAFGVNLMGCVFCCRGVHVYQGMRLYKYIPGTPTQHLSLMQTSEIKSFYMYVCKPGNAKWWSRWDPVWDDCCHPQHHGPLSSPDGHAVRLGNSEICPHSPGSGFSSSPWLVVAGKQMLPMLQ